MKNQDSKPRSISENPFFLVPLILLASFVVLFPMLENAWVNWDDGQYVLDNELIREFSFEQIKKIFLTQEVVGNYHPLSVISLAGDYSLSETEPYVYHLHNLILHLFNSGLVFLFIFLLDKRSLLAAGVAILFALHPMHIESVAWISERKDVLYSFYFLSSLIFYTYSFERTDKKVLLKSLSFIFFLLSLLAKGMAVVLPVILLLIDYLKGRKDYKQMILEKIPFFLLSLSFGLLAMHVQEARNAVSDYSNLGLGELVSIASYGYIMYLLKALIPFQLSAFHPYPNELGQALPSYFYVFPLLILLLTFIFRRFLMGNRKWIFGLGFFSFSILPVLQLLPVGNAIIAERYSYLAYIGLFYVMALAGASIAKWAEDRQAKLVFKIAVTAYLLILAVGSRERLKVWKNGDALWTDVIEKYPDHYYGYACRANYWIEKGNYNQALRDFDQSIKRNNAFADAYINRGLIYTNQGNYPKAILNYNKAIKLAPDNYLPYMNRGALLRLENKATEAIRDLSRSIELNPSQVMSFHNRAIAYRMQGQSDLALADYEDALLLQKENPHLWFEQAQLFLEKNELQKAFQNLKQVIKLEPRYAEAYYFMSKILFIQKEYKAAKEMLTEALKYDFPVEEAYVQELNLK